jgi:hypothetical protein
MEGGSEYVAEARASRDALFPEACNCNGTNARAIALATRTDEDRGVRQEVVLRNCVETV